MHGTSNAMAEMQVTAAEKVFFIEIEVEFNLFFNKLNMYFNRVNM